MPRVTKADFDTIAEFVVDEHRKRQRKRSDLEKVWKEVDRQLAMNPDRKHKLDERGQVIPSRSWMPELELPLQSQTLEVLTADSRRMMAPDSGSWFAAHGLMSDEYLERTDDFRGVIAGDRNDMPSQVTQDNIDKLLTGWLRHQQRQYDFWGTWDHLNAEAFKYGTFVGRARVVTKEVFLDTSKGVTREKQRFPVLFPKSIKNVYLDDSLHKMMNEGHVVGPSTIAEYWLYLKDLKVAAEKGGKDPNGDGGWMPRNVSELEPDDTGHVHLLELEGDLVVPRKTVRSMFLPNVVVTVAIGKNKAKVVRFRFNKFPFTSYLAHPYHVEQVDSPYGVGPLMKGYPIQKAGSFALNMLTAWSILNVAPPVQYESADPHYAATGGPEIAPFALWPTLGEARAVEIGDGSALQGTYVALINQYFDVTGVNAPRLGAQTVSHTTAFAKDAELSRGVVRTVDYVRSVLKGPAERWLSMQYEMGRKVMGETTFYVPEYGGFVTVEKDHIPDMATFEAFGSGGPDEESVKQSRKLAAIQLAAALDQAKVQTGSGQPLNYEAIQKEILGKEFTDIDVFFNQPAAGAVPAGPALPGTAPGGAGTADTALEALL